MGSLAGDKQIFIPSGFYKGCKVAIKRINEKNIHLNREQMLELKKVSQYDRLRTILFQFHCGITIIFPLDERYSSRAFGEILRRLC